MRLAHVVGHVVSTQKNEKLTGAKLLLVQPEAADGTAVGHPIMAVDAAQAGIGERVLLVIEGRAAISALGRRGAPVDVAIVGVVDRVDVESVAGVDPVDVEQDARVDPVDVAVSGR